MCYSKSLSLKSFLFGIVSSLYLYHNKSDISDKSVIVISLFFAFVSLMQLVEYFLWSDLKCTGINQTTSKIGILLNHFQPVVFLIINMLNLESNNNINQNILIILNVIYSIYVMYDYKRFLDEKNFCVKPNKKGHLDWTWKHNFNYFYYHLITFLNLYNYNHYTNLTLSILLSYVLFFISLTKFKDNIGEFWCLMVTGIPFLFSLNFRYPVNSPST
jgi:hypothetical protein